MAGSPSLTPVSAAPRLRLTFDAFLDWELEQETKHEYYHGEVFAMAGGTEPHADIISNLHFALRLALQGRDCKVYTDALGVRIEAVDLYTYPDLSVACGERMLYGKRKTALLNPLVLVEVLSPSTSAYDLTTKWGFYAQIPSLQAYVVVSQESPAVDVYSRDGDGWRIVHTAEDEARIPALDASLALAEVYAGVAFPGPDERTRPTPGV